MSLLSQKQLQGLSQYSYKGVDKSILSKYVLNPFWSQFVKLWPLWVAPNTITLCGLSLVAINITTMLHYDPNYVASSEDPTPHWLYYTWAVGLFLYQSLDAIDGKQARRTGMAGPLGEMFDHGCDAINTTFGAILGCHALNLRRSWWTIACQVTSITTFYLTTWEEYYTGQLYLGFISGPVEGILMVVGIFLISGYYGPQFWDSPLSVVTGIDEVANDWLDSVLNLKLSETIMILGAGALIVNIMMSCANVYSAQKSKSGSLSDPFINLLPCCLTTGLNLLWLASPSVSKSVIINSPLIIPFMFMWGFQFAHQVGRIILAHVTKEPFPWYDPMWNWTALVVLDVHSEYLFGRSPRLQTSYKDYQVVVYMMLLVSFLSYGRFVTLVIQEITEYLGISCFRVLKRDNTGQWTNAMIQAKK